MKLLKIFPSKKDLEYETFLNWKCFQKVPIETTKTSEPKTMICLEQYLESMSWVLTFHGTQIVAIYNSQFCCYLARMLVQVVHGKLIIKLSCFLHWFCWKLLIHGTKCDLNLALAQLSNYNLGTLDLEDQP
jgi:hypothetical protein